MLQDSNERIRQPFYYRNLQCLREPDVPAQTR